MASLFAPAKSAGRIASAIRAAGYPLQSLPQRAQSKTGKGFSLLSLARNTIPHRTPFWKTACADAKKVPMDILIFVMGKAPNSAVL